MRFPTATPGSLRATTGYFRLRVGSLRFIYREHRGKIEVFYVEQRRLVYDLLAAHIARLFEPR